MSNPASAPDLKALHHILARNYGIALVSTFLSCALYGIAFMQMFIYYMRQPQNSFWIKILPPWLLLTLTAHNVVLCGGEYKVLITHSGDWERITTVVDAEPLMADITQGFVTIAARFFFIYRIWKFGKNKPQTRNYIWLFPSVCVPFAVVQLAYTLERASLRLIYGGDTAGFLTAGNAWGDMNYMTFVSHLLLDGMLFAATTWVLNHERRPPVSKARNKINRFMDLTINSGLLPMAIALITRLYLLVSPNLIVYIAFYYLPSPLYCHSVLATLNSRGFLRPRNAKVEAPSKGNSTAVQQNTRARHSGQAK